MDETAVKKFLDYDPVDGNLRWKVGRGRVKKGAIAGCPEKPGGYVRVTIDGVAYPAHRLAYIIMTGASPRGEIDHINGVYDDNRWANLRCVTTSGNARNRALRKDNSTGAPGVYWHQRTGRWYAQACHGGKNRHLGFFASFDEAVQARRSIQTANDYHQNHGREARRLAAQIAQKRAQRMAGRC